MTKFILWNDNIKQFLKGETSIPLPACILYSLRVPQRLWPKILLINDLEMCLKLQTYNFYGCQINQDKQ